MHALKPDRFTRDECDETAKRQRSLKANFSSTQQLGQTKKRLKQCKEKDGGLNEERERNREREIGGGGKVKRWGNPCEHARTNRNHQNAATHPIIK